MTAIRHLVPQAIRRGAAVQLARLQAARLQRELATLASGSHRIVAGPWLGEVGFELLYWVPFLAWFVEHYRVAPERLVIVSRGGVRPWYRPLATDYRELFDVLSPEEFRRCHDARVAAIGEQKQTRILDVERDLLRRLDIDARDRVLHPSSMYRLFSPFWWGHVDESWVHRFTRYRRLQHVTEDAVTLPGPFPGAPRDRGGYTAVKFYFSDSFPATDENRAFVRQVLATLTARGRVVSLTTGLHLDDHGDDPGGSGADVPGVEPLPAGVDPRINLALQSAIVAGATTLVGTYGGFSYLAPFYGVPATAYYGDPSGFSPRHLRMAQSALQVVGSGGLLTVRPSGVGLAVH